MRGGRRRGSKGTVHQHPFSKPPPLSPDVVDIGRTLGAVGGAKAEMAGGGGERGDWRGRAWWCSGEVGISPRQELHATRKRLDTYGKHTIIWRGSDSTPDTYGKRNNNGLEKRK